MNLLFLVHRIPYPPNKGDKIRSWNELRFLASRHRVHLGCFVDQAEDLAHVETLRPLVASLHVVPLDPRRAKLRSLTALLTGEPLSTRYFSSRSLHTYVGNLLNQEKIDVALLFSSPMAEYVRRTKLPLVMDFVDVDSDKWRQYASRARMPLSFLYGLEARRLRLYEEEILHRCAAATLVTQQEKALLKNLPAGLQDKVHVVPNGVDLEFFGPSALPEPPAREPHSMVFTGAMDYFANVDAVIWFAQEVFPRIRAAFPDARFYIVGSHPTAEVVALSRRPGIVVTGFVDDIRSYYLRAALSVVPLRIARGIQNKVLEAMAMGRPVLATEPAYEGLGARRDSEICVTETSEALAATAIRLLEDPQRAESIGASGRRFVEREYVWERSMQLLEDQLFLAAGKRPEAQPVLV